MQEEKDRHSDSRKGPHRKSFVDSRTSIKAIYEYRGHKLLVTLKSFFIESEQTRRVIETLPLAYLKLMIAHVSSNRVARSIESAMHSEGSSMVVIDYEKMEGRVNQLQNNEDKYS